MRGYLLQERFATDVPDTKRALRHAAQQDTTQQHPEHPPYKRRYVARVSLALDCGPAEGQPENRQMLFQIRGTMPPEPRLCFTKGLELCTGAELEELARAQPGTTKNKHTRQICCRTKFRKLERLNSWLAEAIPTRRRSNDQGVRSTTKAGAVGHAFSQERR